MRAEQGHWSAPLCHCCHGAAVPLHGCNRATSWWLSGGDGQLPPMHGA
jgi:hypothetical protein